MTAEAMPIAPAPEGWTIDDVDALPEDGTRWELVDGVPRAMTPARFKHQRARSAGWSTKSRPLPRLACWWWSASG